MSDEEKKAINLLKSYENKLVYEISEKDKKAVKTILNLIEKQSKEIEEYKKQLDLDNECEIALNSKVMDLEKEIEELKEDNKHQWEERCKLTFELENSTSNDKIKAKIEEVEQWELYNMKIPRLSTLDERLGAKIGIKYVLQSFLEKE